MALLEVQRTVSEGPISPISGVHYLYCLVVARRHGAGIAELGGELPAMLAPGSPYAASGLRPLQTTWRRDHTGRTSSIKLRATSFQAASEAGDARARRLPRVCPAACPPRRAAPSLDRNSNDLSFCRLVRLAEARRTKPAQLHENCSQEPGVVSIPLNAEQPMTSRTPTTTSMECIAAAASDDNRRATA
jgi:hypothetical protein